MMNIEIFLDDVRNEFYRARKLFPSNRHQLAAFNEEAGELTKAMVDLDQGTTNAAVRKEAIQSAVMAARVALEGDAGLPYNPKED